MDYLEIGVNIVLTFLLPNAIRQRCSDIHMMFQFFIFLHHFSHLVIDVKHLSMLALLRNMLRSRIFIRMLSGLFDHMMVEDWVHLDI